MVWFLPQKKNWILHNLPLHYDWILIVDVDEHITPELAADIVARTNPKGRCKRRMMLKME
jgi:hypothetical protein